MKKKNYKNLITTGLKELNARKDDLFLGEWCLTDSRFKKKISQKFAIIILIRKIKLKKIIVIL